MSGGYSKRGELQQGWNQFKFSLPQPTSPILEALDAFLIGRSPI